MADLSITAANVGPKGTTLRIEIVQVGEAVTEGQPAYQSTTDDKYYQTDANASQEKARAVGIFMSAASTDGYAILGKFGPINLGATLTVGETYVVSGTKGGIAPLADVTTGWYVTILGVASSASQLDLNIRVSEVARA